MARQILGISVRRSLLRFRNVEARREQFWRYTDTLREHSGFSQERDFQQRVRRITMIADSLYNIVRRWPQLPDSQFYALRSDLFYLVVGLQNYPQVCMTVEDYTVHAEPYDPIDFERSWVHDTWFSETCTLLMNSVENVMETVYSPDPTRTGQARWSSQESNWTLHMDRLIRVAAQHRRFAYGSRPVRAWFDDLTVPQSFPTASSLEPDDPAVTLEDDSDNVDGDFSYWRTIGSVSPLVEHRVWANDGRRIRRRAERQEELLRHLEDIEEEVQNLANEFQ
jgi:hypothetical protein